MISGEEVILRLVVATILSAIIGMERERLERAAGLRTHALVGVGSALVIIVSAFGFRDILGTQDVVLDPSRIAAQVVSGIGFLGAGTIIFQREVIRGLTTAASVWAVAAIGLAAGAGLFLAAVSTTIVVLIILAGIKPLERRFFQHRRPNRLTLLVDQQAGSLFAIEAATRAAHVHLERMLIHPGEPAEADSVELVLHGAHDETLLELVDRLRRVPGVREIMSETLNSR
ncbi:MAG TPA: MgtC/SapB family protein [Dehalococcoidia bacterium]|nr:MgtC/SapB family protein [Dehalococcoidia bacterium]